VFAKLTIDITYYCQIKCNLYNERMAEWTPERRAKQREVAKRLVEEGKFGGSGRGQGRPRKPRASELVAEKVNEHAEELWERLYGIAINSKSEAVAQKTIMDLLQIEERERQIVVEEERRYEDMKRGELLEYVTFMLGGVLANADTGTRERIIGIGPAEVVEIDDGSISGNGEEPRRFESESGD